MKKQFDHHKLRRFAVALKNGGINMGSQARHLGVSQSLYSLWLNGHVRPRDWNVTKLCSMFGCNRDDLLTPAMFDSGK